MNLDRLAIMREGAARRAARLAALAANTRECAVCGRRFPADGGTIVRYTEDHTVVHMRRLCANCGARLAAWVGRDA